MQSEGSSYGPSARDGGLLDSMKTLKISPPKPPVLRGPLPSPPPTPNPSRPHTPLLYFPTQSHATTTTTTSPFDSTPFLKAPAVETLNWTRQSRFSRSTLTQTTFSHWKKPHINLDVRVSVSFLFTISFTAIQGTALRKKTNKKT